jgi:hypothetical protein
VAANQQSVVRGCFHYSLRRTALLRIIFLHFTKRHRRALSRYKQSWETSSVAPFSFDQQFRVIRKPLVVMARSRFVLSLVAVALSISLSNADFWDSKVATDADQPKATGSSGAVEYGVDIVSCTTPFGWHD